MSDAVEKPPPTSISVAAPIGRNVRGCKTLRKMITVGKELIAGSSPAIWYVSTRPHCYLPTREIS